MTNQTPQLILLMGVSGSGKTTVGLQLAARLGYSFLDADDFHSPEAIDRMRSGLPLTDAMRDTWVERLHAALTDRYNEQTSCVLAFSGLRTKHRRRLMATGFTTVAFMLVGNPGLLAHRLAQRRGHFMHVSQLQDQLTTMQPFEADEAITPLNISATPGDIVDALVNRVTGAM